MSLMPVFGNLEGDLVGGRVMMDAWWWFEIGHDCLKEKKRKIERKVEVK